MLGVSPLPSYGPDKGSILDFLFSQSQDGLRQPIFSPQLLGHNPGAISPSQGTVGICHPRSLGSTIS